MDRFANIIVRRMMCMLSIGMLAGCSFRPLTDPEYNTYVRIKVNTDNIRNVTSDIYNEDIERPEIAPEVMHVLFYEPDGNSLVAESFASENSVDEDGYTWISGYMSLVPGDYRMLAYNFGTEGTTVDGYGNYETAVAGSGTVSEQILSRYSSKAPGEVVVYEPDHLTVANLELETVPFHDGIHVIEAEATTLVETWYLQIKVEGLEYVSGAEAFLSGMSGNSGMSDAKDGEKDHTVYFTLQKGEDDGVPVICNVFNTFGRIPGSDNSLRVTFDIRTVDGRNETREFDITDLFSTEAALEHNWLLLEETITIDPPAPPEPGEGGGFQPGVGEWDDEDHEIVI